MKDLTGFLKESFKNMPVSVKIFAFLALITLYFLFTSPLNALTPKWRIHTLFSLFITIGILFNFILIRSSYQDYKLSIRDSDMHRETENDVIQNLENRVSNLEKKYSAWYFHMHGIIFAIAILFLAFVMSKVIH